MRACHGQVNMEIKGRLRSDTLRFIERPTFLDSWCVVTGPSPQFEKRNTALAATIVPWFMRPRVPRNVHVTFVRALLDPVACLLSLAFQECPALSWQSQIPDTRLFVLRVSPQFPLSAKNCCICELRGTSFDFVILLFKGHVTRN